MNRDESLALADRILVLINAQPSTPSREEIAEVIGHAGETFPGPLTMHQVRDALRQGLIEQEFDLVGDSMTGTPIFKGEMGVFEFDRRTCVHCGGAWNDGDGHANCPPEFRETYTITVAGVRVVASNYIHPLSWTGPDGTVYGGAKAAAEIEREEREKLINCQYSHLDMAADNLERTLVNLGIDNAKRFIAPMVLQSETVGGMRLMSRGEANAQWDTPERQRILADLRASFAKVYPGLSIVRGDKS